MDDDGYEGAAELRVGERRVPVTVRLTGQFEPITGQYHWYGRIAASPQVAALLAAGVRAVVLQTPHRAVRTALADVDPWGRPRVAGFGPAPFPVADRLPEPSG